MTLIIGLTGGIASGKSTVSNMIKEYGFPVIDADVIAREVVNIGEEAYNNIVAAFGTEILQPDQSIDRQKLGSIIFSDESKRLTLNKIVHPAVRKKMLEKKDEYLKQGHPAIVMDIPLLFESNLTSFVDKIIVVFVEPGIQIARLTSRNDLSNDDAMDRVSSQMSLYHKVALADEVIDNNGKLEHTKQQLHQIFQKWKLID